MAGNAYGEDEVYYCSDIDSNGFKINKEHGSYKPQLFEMKKFKMKLNRTANSVELAHDEGERRKFACTSLRFKSDEKVVHCQGNHLNTFIYNSSNKRYSLSWSQGYVLSDNPASLSISYGTCDKF